MATLEAWGEAGKKYNIHEETLSYFKAREGVARPYHDLTVAEARQASLDVALTFSGDVPDFDGEVKEFKVPSPACKDGIPVDVYKPTDVTISPPVLVVFHGGGHTVGSRRTMDSFCKIMARDAHCIVVNVEYRLAPEDKPPADFDDAVCVVRWTIMNKAVIGGTYSSKVGVCGDSAGGQLASSVCFDVPGISFQILLYPDTDWRHEHPSIKEFASTPGLSMDMITWFEQSFLADEKYKTDPRISTLLKPSHADLPPALIIVAELDPLRDSCYAYKQKLQEAKIPVESMTLKGAPHGFIHLPGHFKELCGKSYTKIVNFINKFDSNRKDDSGRPGMVNLLI